MITVFTKPNCVQCDRTKKLLDKEKIPYIAIDITEDAPAAARLRSIGVRTMPFVVTPDDEWSGFRPDKLRSINQ